MQKKKRNILFLKRIYLILLERQFKAYSKQRERLLNHVTLSINPQHPNVKNFNTFVQKMVPHMRAVDHRRFVTSLLKKFER